VFNLFKRKTPKEQKTDNEQFEIFIKSNSKKEYELLDIEEMFISELFNKMKAKNLNCALINFDRKADGTLNICYGMAQIGRIKLQGRKTRMQILNPVDVKWFENESIEFYIEKLDIWIDYIARHLK